MSSTMTNASGRTHRRVAAATLGAVLLGNLLFGGTSIVGAAPAGGAIQVFVTPNDSGGGPIVITGAIGDYGQTRSIDKNGKADPNGEYVKITLQKGTFEVNAVTFNTTSRQAQPTVNFATCSAQGSSSGPVTFYNGTGLYQGISGTVRITSTFAAVFPPYSSGKNKGKCNTSNNAQPIAQYSSITGAGMVKFS
jgi:hypothetical protein